MASRAETFDHSRRTEETNIELQKQKRNKLKKFLVGLVGITSPLWANLLMNAGNTKSADSGQTAAQLSTPNFGDLPTISELAGMPETEGGPSATGPSQEWIDAEVARRNQPDANIAPWKSSQVTEQDVDSSPPSPLPTITAVQGPYSVGPSPEFIAERTATSVKSIPTITSEQGPSTPGPSKEFIQDRQNNNGK